MKRIQFYARLEHILHSYAEGSGRRRLFPVAIDEDRWRLAGYFIVDWVLKSEGEPFTAADLLREGEAAEFDPLLRISRRNVDHLLDHLAKHRILEAIREMGATATVYGGIAGTNDKVFCLTGEVRYLLYGFAAQHESERADREVSLAPGGDYDAAANEPPPGASAVATPVAAGYTGSPSVVVMPSPKVLGGRYELGELIGQGGLSSVYKGRDLVTGRQVVVKLLRYALGKDPDVIARFRREAEISKGLVHSHVARTYDVLDGPDDSPALIMEWLNGPNLENLIRDDGPMPPAEVAGIGRILAAALSYVASQRVIRLDLKPSNIVMADRGPVITDLGTALWVGTGEQPLTARGQFVGTPAFIAPEVIEGHDPDARADIYALGLVLYFCLAGRSPWEDLPNVSAVISAVVNEQVELASLPISAAFRDALGRSLARKRDDRFPDAAAFQDALSKTPEWRSVSGEE